MVGEKGSRSSMIQPSRPFTELTLSLTVTQTEERDFSACTGNHGTAASVVKVATIFSFCVLFVLVCVFDFICSSSRVIVKNEFASVLLKKFPAAFEGLQVTHKRTHTT
jgi:hypothetical protein